LIQLLKFCSIFLLKKPIFVQTLIKNNMKNNSTFLLLSIQDSGIGMDKITIDNVFEPFFSMEQSGNGTGLGLSVVEGLVMAHNGAIAIESTMNKGTTFIIYFPY
jgi:signal transduction histidine kinase